MSEQEPDDTAPSADDVTEATARERRRRLAAVFGDVLPEQTSDDRTPTTSPEPGRDRDDQWWRDQVPPHHE